MAITMTGSGGLFTRLGSMGRLMNIINRFTGDDTISLTGSSVITDLRTEFDLVKVQFDGSEFPISQVIEGMHADVDAQISNFANLLRRIQAAATDLVVRTVMADNPIPDLTIDSALAELITQMLAGGYYVSSSTISTTLSAGGSNVGDGTIVTSMKDDIGRPAYHCFQESLRVAVTTGGTLGSERLKVSG